MLPEANDHSHNGIYRQIYKLEDRVSQLENLLLVIARSEFSPDTQRLIHRAIVDAVPVSKGDAE